MTLNLSQLKTRVHLPQFHNEVKTVMFGLGVLLLILAIWVLLKKRRQSPVARLGGLSMET